MIAVLARLQWMTLRGRVLRSIRLLRQPKYLVGFIVGFGWIAFWVIRPLLHSRFSLGTMPSSQSGAALPAIHRIAALVVTIGLPLPWLWPWGRLGLPFREAELTMLLQAPLTRRQIIQYGLLKSELGVVLSALVSSLLLGGRGGSGRLATFLGMWILFEFWHLNGKWRAMFNLRQTEISVASARKRRFVVTVGLLGFYGALVVALRPFLASAGAAFDVAQRGGIDAISSALEWPPLLVALLAPAWGLTAPVFAVSAAGFFAALVPALLLIVAEREVVLRAKARFEEGALEHAKTQETRKSPTRRFARLSSRARSRYPFELDRRGPQENALLWKNLLRVSRVPWTRVVFAGSIILVTVGALPAVLRLHDLTYGLLAAIGATLMFMPPLLAGMTWNNDLRTELAHIELVRTWPVPAQRFVLAEVLSPAVPSFVLSMFGAAMVLIGLFGGRLRQAVTDEQPELDLLPQVGGSLGAHPGLAMVLLIASLLPLAAAVSFFSSALQNLATLFVPAWTAYSVDRTQGLAAFGRRMVFSWALTFALLLAMIPSAMLVGAAALIQRLLGISWSAWVFPFWGILAATPVLAGGWAIVHVAARLWERLDPSQEMLEIGR